jgi:putative hydrolase of the HAD superfamily
MTIKAITFDLDDTLWPVKPTLKRAEIETYEWLKLHASKLTEQHSLREIGEFRYALFLNQPHFKNQISQVRIESIRQLAEKSGYSATDADEIAKQSFQLHYQLRQKVNCYSGVEAMLKQLSKHFILGALSNGNADISLTPLADVFSFSVTAEKINVSKPEHAFFSTAHQAIEKLYNGVIAPEEVLHVGDDFYCDIIGANQFGYKTVWLNHEKSCQHPELKKPINIKVQSMKADIEKNLPEEYSAIEADETIYDIRDLEVTIKKRLAQD